MAKKPKTNHVLKEPTELEVSYEEEVSFKCPVRGLVTQKVKVKRYRSAGDNYVPAFVIDSENDEFDIKEDLGFQSSETDVYE